MQKKKEKERKRADMGWEDMGSFRSVPGPNTHGDMAFFLAYLKQAGRFGEPGMPDKFRLQLR